MIPSSIVYTNIAGASIELNEAPPNFRYPVFTFEMPTYQEGQPQSKMQQPGEWPTFSYPRYRVFNLTGAILGNDASGYNDAVGDLKQVVQPPFAFYDQRRHGRLSLVFYGDGATYYADVQLVTLDVVKEANYPSVSDFSLSWRSFEPYLRAASTGAVTVRY
jgi:hypothetical protein